MLPVYLRITIPFFATLFFTPFFRYVAHQLKILDSPDGKIKTHHKPTAYLGGLALFLGFAVSLLFPLGYLSFNFSFFVYGLILLLIVGLVDDLYPITAGTKFFFQIGATYLFIKAGLVAQFALLPTAINFFISAFWMLTIINAFNLIDIMDGLASLVGIIIISNFVFVAWLLGYSSVVLLLTGFLGALLGFLFYNKPPATIYLGDAGSLFLGGLIATLPFMIKWHQLGSMGFLIPIILCVVPFLEVATLVVIRTSKKIPFWQASPDHFAQLLQCKGWPKRKILFYLLGIGFFQAVIVLGYIKNWLPGSLLLLLFFIFVLIWYFALFCKRA